MFKDGNEMQPAAPAIAPGAGMCSPQSDYSRPKASTPVRYAGSPSGSPFRDAGCSLFGLPDEILLSMLSFMPINDLSNVVQTCRRLHRLGTSPSVQSQTSFGDSWPYKQKRDKDSDASDDVLLSNVAVFERAARLGNFEANIKLGVACLYGEGLEPSAETAYEMLNRCEEMVGASSPFAWLLFRPPWSSESCSKAKIFQNMQRIAEENMHVWTKKYSGIMFCVAKTLSLQSDDASKVLAEKWFTRAADKGCGDAAYELYQLRRRGAGSQSQDYDLSAGTDNIRMLRQYEASGSWKVVLQLCAEYADGRFGGATPQAAMEYVRHSVRSHADPARTLSLQKLMAPRNLDKNGKMRYILVDWLVEVADLKQFSRDTLYMTVDLVDRFLERHDVGRKTLQLLGISCMVIAARFTETEVITIREAAWLTDNTYQYEEVVRTMGKALCSATGRLRVPTHLDFLRLYVTIEKVPKQVADILHYIAELSLLNIPIGHIKPALLAAAVFYVGGVGMRLPEHQWWPARLQSWTGLTLDDIAPYVLKVQIDCFDQEEVTDHREERLKAVADRYTRHTGTELKDSGFVPPTLSMMETHLRARSSMFTMDGGEADDMATDEPMEMDCAGGFRALGPATRFTPTMVNEGEADAAPPQQPGPDTAGPMMVEPSTAVSAAHATAANDPVAAAAAMDVDGEGPVLRPLGNIGNMIDGASSAVLAAVKASSVENVPRQQTPFIDQLNGGFLVANSNGAHPASESGGSAHT